MIEGFDSEVSIRNDLIDALKEKGLTLSAAESCTGGLIGKLMTDSAVQIISKEVRLLILMKQKKVF